MSPRKLLMFGPLPIRIMVGIAFIVAGLPISKISPSIKVILAA
ncbi:MAG: hypothetical protein WBV72_01885 [Nitrososphaeraceae archaeon]